MKSLFTLLVLLVAVNFSLQSQTFASSTIDSNEPYASLSNSLDIPVANDNVIKATFPGGVKAMKAYFLKEFSFTDMARENGFEGTIIVRCTIDDQGRPTEATIVQSVHPMIDAKALATVQNMPNWSPAMINGQPQATSIDIPFQLRLR